MKKPLSPILKLTVALSLLTFLFSPKANAATCEVEVRGGQVIINLEDLGTANSPISYKITAYTDTCKTFNAGQNYQKAFCNEVEPQQVGENFTTAQIKASVFHSGHYYVFVHFKGGSCPVETSNPLTQCEFKISAADGAYKCGPGSCGATQNTTACPIGVPITDADKCCSIDSTTTNCSQGYKPVPDLCLTSGETYECCCRCDEDFTAQYEPCRPIKKQCEAIKDECDKIADPAEKTECQNNKLANCQKEYDACLACVNPPDPDKEPGVWTALGCIAVQPGEFIATLIRIGFGIGGGIAFLFMILGAFKFLTSEGNPETINAGRQMIINAVTGLVLIVFSIIVLKIIGVDVLELPGFAKP